jgi:hypothetical protein
MIAERGSRGKLEPVKTTAKNMGLFQFYSMLRHTVYEAGGGGGAKGAENLLESAKRTVSRDQYDPHRFCFLMHASDLVRIRDGWGGGGGDGSL